MMFPVTKFTRVQVLGLLLTGEAKGSSHSN